MSSNRAPLLLLLLALPSSLLSCESAIDPATETPTPDAPAATADAPLATADAPTATADAPPSPPPSCTDGTQNGGETGVDCGGPCAPCDPPPPPPLDVTFYVVSDTHADPPQDSYDLRAISRVINAVSDNGMWPATIGGAGTGFLGGPIAPPAAVVFTGDLTGWGTAPTEIGTFRHYFQQDASDVSIDYPAYIGLGNHDLDDADRPPALGDAYRAIYWSWVDERHAGPNAPVPVTSFDPASHAYSWDIAGVHFVQLHRFPGDDNYALPSSLPFLHDDLADFAADGRPVFLFHHYAMDSFGTQDRWWTAADRDAYRDLLSGYDIAGIFAGHSHFAMQYDWEDLRVFQPNNAKAENGTGNNDGNGSFAIVHITDDRLEVVTCRWLDDAGHYELIAPYYSGPASTGLAP
jgi:cytolysin (calcineurin-like family phosphatase)